jgi:hypothetical protein
MPSEYTAIRRCSVSTLLEIQPPLEELEVEELEVELEVLGFNPS